MLYQLSYLGNAMLEEPLKTVPQQSSRVIVRSPDAVQTVSMAGLTGAGRPGRGRFEDRISRPLQPRAA